MSKAGQWRTADGARRVTVEAGFGAPTKQLFYWRASAAMLDPMSTKAPHPFATALSELSLVPTEAAARAEKDPLIPLVVEVLDELLAVGEVVTCVDVLVRLEILTVEQVSAWRRGQLPYLERAITAGLNKVGRILRVLDSEARARGMTPSEGRYVRSGKGPKRRLRFSKRGDSASEASYARHYQRPASR